MRVVADRQGRELVEVANSAPASLVCESSVGDQQIEKDEALTLILNVLQAVETWVQTLRQEDALLAQRL